MTSLIQKLSFVFVSWSLFGLMGCTSPSLQREETPLANKESSKGTKNLIRVINSDDASLPRAFAISLTSIEHSLRIQIKKLRTEHLEEAFSIRVALDTADSNDLPAVASDIAIEKDTLILEPIFPLSYDVRYKITWAPTKNSPLYKLGRPEVLQIFQPNPKTEPSTFVTQVFPSSNKLPENQLKFYIHFSAPMRQGSSYTHIKLIDGKGMEVKRPFLTLGEELWDFENQRFTLFFDPGRIKRELVPREELGPALINGKSYKLVIESSWKDADGLPLTSKFEKSFRVIPPDFTCPDIELWKLSIPKVGTRDPFKVTFREPLDHALISRLLWVENQKFEQVQGKVEITDSETQWQFIPQEKWQVGRYEIVARSIIEDLAGNSLDRPFEVDIFTQVKKEIEIFEERRSFIISPLE